MYLEAHRDRERHPQPLPPPVPLPRPGDDDPADAAPSAYAGDAPAIPLDELGSWLST